MTTAYTSLLGLALPVTGELSGTWGDTVNTAITSLLDTAIAGTTSITTDADITLTTTTGASNQARQAIILWNPASGTVTRNITAPAQSKMYTVINASGGTQSIVIRGAGPTTGVTVLKGESALVAWNGSDFVKVSTVGGSGTFIDLTVTGNTILGDAAADTLTVNATSTFAAPVSFQGLVRLPSTGRSAAAALTPTAPAFLYGVASTYTDTASSGTLAPVGAFYALSQPTLSTSNVTTYTTAATLYIANAPAAAGSATITNPYSLYVAAGNSLFAGKLYVADTTDSTSLITGSVQTLGGMAVTKSIVTGGTLVVSGVGQAAIFNNTTGTYSTYQYNGTSVGDIGTGSQVVSAGATLDFGLNVRSATGKIIFGVNSAQKSYMYSGGDFNMNSVRVGLGAAAVATNTVVGLNSLDNASTTGGYNLAVGTLSGRVITSGNENVAIGSTVLAALTTGIRNTAVGNNALQANVGGSYNVAVGMTAGVANTGSGNVFVGYAASGTGTSNSITGMVAVGYQALYGNTGYSNQTAVGYEALYTGGGGNETAIGYRATYTANNTGGVNTSVGYEAMNRPLTPVRNVAVGYRAMYGAVGSTPIDSVAVGNETLLAVTTGGTNVAVGFQVLKGNTSGSSNTAVGYQALSTTTTSSGNTAVGYQAAYLSTGSFIDAFGNGALSANSTGNGNSAFGRAVLSVNETGSENAAFGTAYGVYAALRFNVSGSYNAAFGAGALANNISASNNTAVGYRAGYTSTTGTLNVYVGGDAGKLSTGSYNTFMGQGAGQNTTTATSLVIIGQGAGSNVTTGTYNVYIGEAAGVGATASTNNTGSYNVGVGGVSMYATTTGSYNTAVGHEAQRLLTTGTYNSALGFNALYNNTSGANNSAVGTNALVGNLSGANNTAIGYQAGFSNQTTNSNIFVGMNSGYTHQTGQQSVYVGYYTGYYRNGATGQNTFLGSYAGHGVSGSSTGNTNTFVGYTSGYNMTTGSNNTILGSFDGNQGSLDIRTSSNNIVLSDGSGNPQFYIRYGDSSTTAYRLRTDFHGFGRLYSGGTLASAGTLVLNVNGTGNDGSIGTMGVLTRWTSVDGGDSVALYTIAHGNTYNTYTLITKSEVNSITITESSGSITIVNGSANQISYQFVYTVFSTGELIRAQI